MQSISLYAPLGKNQNKLKMRLLSMAILAAISGPAEATMVIDSSDVQRTFSNDTDYLLDADKNSNSLIFTGKSGLTFTNYGTIVNTEQSSSAVRLNVANATFINHGTARSDNGAAIVLKSNDHVILGTGSVLKGSNNYAIYTFGTGNTVTLTSDNASTTIENGDFLGDSDDQGLKQLTSAAGSHWQLGGNIGLAGKTADTLSVAGDLTLTGHVSQYSANGGTTIAKGGTLTIGTNGVVDGNIIDNGSLIVNSAKAVILDKSISGSGSLTHAGANTLTLTGNNTYTGTTTINHGSTLILGNNGTTGSVAGSIVDNGTLMLSHSDAFTLGNQISGKGSVGVNNGKTAILTADNTYTGQTTINRGATLVLGDGGTTGRVAGNIFSSGTLVVNHSDNVTLGQFLGNSSLIQAGKGSTTLTDQNSSLVEIQANSGSLILAQMASIKTALINVATGAVLKVEKQAGLDILGHGNLEGELDLDLGHSGPQITGDNLTLGTNSTLKVAGVIPDVDTASQLASTSAMVIQTTGGITGDFAHVELSDGVIPDYLLFSGTKSTDGKSYSVGEALAWTSTSDDSNGTFTLATANNHFNVDVALGDQSANATTGWDGKSLTKAGNGNLILSAANTYTGTTSVKSGTLTTGIAHALDNSINIDVASQATLDLNNNAQTLKGLTGAGKVNLGSANLEIDNAGSDTFAGVISGTGSLTKAGTGNLILSGDSTFSGDTSVNAGTLSLAKNSAAGSGAIIVNNAGQLDLTFNDAAFTHQLSGAGQVKVSGKNVALNEDATAFTGAWDITGSAHATQQSELGSATLQLDGSQSELTLNNFASPLTNALTGNGTLSVNQNSKTDDFSLANSTGAAFTGTVQMQQGNFILDGNAEQALSDATLSLNKTSSATMADDRQIGGLILGGGTLIVDNSRTDADTLTTKTLDASAGGTIQANIPDELTPPVVPTHPSYFEQDDIRNVQVVKTTGEVTGIGNHITLLDQDGNPVSNATEVDIIDGNQQLGTATYDNAARVTEDGIWVGYDLVKLSADAGQTLVLQNEAGHNNTLGTQLSGAGNFDVQASGTVILNNKNNDYTGNTRIDSGNVQLGSDNALGHTADVSLAANTGLDINGKTQAINSLHGASGSNLNINGGNLSIAQGGESQGMLSGGGQLNLNGGELIVHGANHDLSATTHIANAATVTLNNAQGLGNGEIDLAGNLNLTGANGVLSNSLTGNGTLSLQDRALVTLANTANTFAGDINIATGSQLTAQGAGTLGTAAITDNGSVVLDNATDWTFTNAINGSGTLIQNGAGNTTLANSNHYTGGTDVNAGSLSLAKNDAAGSGAIHVNGGSLDLTFSDASFTNQLTGAGNVNVSGTDITLNEDATAFTGNWDITGSASATQQSQLGSAGVQLDGIQSKLTLNHFGNTFGSALSGNGTLEVNQASKTDDFTLASSTDTAFTGTVDMQQGNLILDGNAEKTLADATLNLTQTGMATMDSDRSIGNLTYGGGTLRIDNSQTDAYTLTTNTLDARAGGTIEANIPAELSPPIVPTSPSYFDQDVVRNIQVVKTTGEVAGQGNHITLLDQDGNSVSSATQVDIVDGDQQLGSATYDNAAVVTEDGIWVGYDLVKLSANAEQTLTLQNEAGHDNMLIAQLSGAGNFAVQADGTVILNNKDNDYTGNTLIDSGNVQLGSDNALGHTADVILAASTGLDINGKTQAITSLHSATGSNLNINGGNLSIAQGGESLGALSGSGQLNLNGGEFIVHGANQDLSATTHIANAATATLDDTLGLGNGEIDLAGNLNLIGANGVLSNSLTGNGSLSLQDSALVTLANTASTFAGDINIATGSQLTAQAAGSLGTASVVDNGNLVLNTPSDWTLTNAISGSGSVNKTGAGSLTVGKEQTWRGDTHISQGALNVDGDFGSTGTVYVEQAGTLKGHGSIAGSVDNSGVIDLTSDTVGNNLVIGGDYNSHDGQLWVNSTLGGDNSAHDQLTVKGNTRGNTNVTVHNMLGLGAETQYGIELVDVQGHSEGTFTLQGRAVAGAYEYALNKASDGNWYLQSGTTPPDPDPTPEPDPTPVTHNLRPEAGAYLANQSLANSVFMNTMHDRSDVNRQSGEDAPATWAHFDAGRINSKGGNGALSMGSNTSILRIGSDVFRHDFGNQRINAGVMTGYANVDTDSNAKHVSSRATGHLKGYNFGVYGTWYGGTADQKTGPYVDTWMQYGTFHNSVTGDELSEEKYHAHNWTTSVEMGYDLPVGGLSSVYIQPQFQTLYTHYSEGDHVESNGTRIQSQDSGGVTTRLGARLYGELGTDTITQPYVELNWWHGGSDNSVKMDATTVDQNIPVSRYEVKVGAQVKASKNWTLWISSGVETGKDSYSSVQGQVGGKYSW